MLGGFGGGWIRLEHPGDRIIEPSFFNTAEVAFFKQMCKVKYWVLDQCRFGAPSQKRAGMLLPYKSHAIALTCDHGHGHKALLGLDERDRFKTTPPACYPVSL